MKKLILLILFPAIISGCTLIPKKSSQSEDNNIESVVDTTSWVTFTDKSLGISFKHPADCTINGAGPGLSASNAVNCQNSTVSYQPLNYSYYIDNAKYYTNLDSQGIAELFYKTNLEDKSSNKPVDRYISKPEKINLSGIEAYQIGIDWGVEFPVGQSYVIDGRHKLTFLVLGDKKLFIDSDDDLIAGEILKTFKFIDDNQAASQNSNTVCSGPEFHRDGLYLCDKKIGSLPYNVKDLNKGDGQSADLIVFADGDVIKTISNKAPYAQKTIAKNINLESDGSLGPCFYYNGLYSCDIQAGGPGDFNQVFTFDPNDNRFIFAVYKVWSGKPSEMKLSSAFSDSSFTSSIDTQCPPTNEMPGCTYSQATSLDININGKFYNKQDYLVNKDNIGDFIGCLGHFDFNSIALGRHIKDSQGDLYPSINSVSDNFSSKRINCLNYNSGGEQIGINGYIDLEQSKFVVTK